jgi:hypothetical protein
VEVSSCDWNSTPLREQPWPLGKDRHTASAKQVADLYPQKEPCERIVDSPEIEKGKLVVRHVTGGTRQCRQPVVQRVKKQRGEWYCVKIFDVSPRNSRIKKASAVLAVAGSFIVSAAGAAHGFHDLSLAAASLLEESGGPIGALGAAGLGLSWRGDAAQKKKKKKPAGYDKYCLPDEDNPVEIENKSLEAPWRTCRSVDGNHESCG